MYMKQNNSLYKAAALLGVDTDSLKGLPEHTQNAMVTVVEVMKIDEQDGVNIAYTELERLWLGGLLESGMREIAGATGIPYKTLSILPDKARQEIYYAFCYDSKDIEGIYRLVQTALSSLELKNVSDVLNIPLAELEKLPNEVQEQLCGMYAMEYGDENLAVNLRELYNMLWLI